MRMIVVPKLGGPEVLTLAQGDKPAIEGWPKPQSAPMVVGLDDPPS